ncbi:hypothetical protein [Mycobacterium hubeiense]|uniref:hypothetical protein n=1 Tax=Mycobacterium hubeiense TaxID=1867256 RepID=UPI0018EA7B30|nr:hypothetical protein [Mycobacterium sp. QGD 101]
MGYFSADCLACGHPLLCEWVTNTINAWMTAGVAVTESGSVLKGRYDGYGALISPRGERFEDAVGMTDTSVWHEACWTANGAPTDYRGPSRPSADQGFFFDDGDHALPEPRVVPVDGSRPGVLITYAQLASWTGRELTESDLARITDALPHSSIPDAIGEIASALEGS